MQRVNQPSSSVPGRGADEIVTVSPQNSAYMYGVLSSFALSQPQAAYAAFTRGLASRWTFLCRVQKEAPEAMAPVEHIIYTKLLPNLTGQPIDAALRHFFSLPCGESGLGVLDPTALGTQYCSSRSVTSSLVENIVAQRPQLGDALATVSHMKTRARNEARRRIQEAAAAFNSAAPESLQRTILSTWSANLEHPAG